MCSSDLAVDTFSILLIPHTLAVTTWGERRAGDELNIEVDQMARYAARLVAEFGANRIAWGSNYPSSPGSLRDILAATRAMLAELSDADRAWIFGGTAETLYPSLKG